MNVLQREMMEDMLDQRVDEYIEELNEKDFADLVLSDETYAWVDQIAIALAKKSVVDGGMLLMVNDLKETIYGYQKSIRDDLTPTVLEAETRRIEEETARPARPLMWEVA